MGYLAATGAYLILALAIGFIIMVVGLFVGHIIVFDSIALGIISGVCCNHFFPLHPGALPADRRSGVRAASVFAKNAFRLLDHRDIVVRCMGGYFRTAGVYHLQRRPGLVFRNLRDFLCYYAYSSYQSQK